MADAHLLRDIRLLGEGAQARVYLVEHTGTGERHVVKRCTTASKGAAESAQREVEILARMSHPSITRIFAAWRSDEAGPSPTLHILMEYAEGGSLAQAIKARAAISAGPFDEGIVVEYVVQIASALAYMHDRSVLHRDLKAANCFLTSRNLIKVGDFGIAKTLEAAGSDGALARTAVGTPYYLAPELVSGEPYAYRADMWALGVLLYELIALRRPFEAQTLPQLALKIVQVDYKPITPKEGFSAELVALLGSLLRREPASRPSAARLCDAPIVRRHHARLHAQLRALAMLTVPSVAMGGASGTAEASEDTTSEDGNLAALEANLANLEHAGQKLPERAVGGSASRRAGGGTTPFSSPVFAVPTSPAPAVSLTSPLGQLSASLTSPLGLANHTLGGSTEQAGSKHKPGVHSSPWVETRRKRSVATMPPASIE